MSTEPAIDARALKILRKYNILAALYAVVSYPLNAQQQEYMAKHSTSPEDMAYLKQHGLAFDMVDITHDEAVQKCFEYYALLNKKHVTNLFLASLSSNRLDWRSGLSAFAPSPSCKQCPIISMKTPQQNVARFALPRRETNISISPR